jgi:hypothetical protein
MEYAVQIAPGDMIYLLSFMKMGTYIQRMLMYCLNNVRGCNVDIFDGGGFKIQR